VSIRVVDVSEFTREIPRSAWRCMAETWGVEAAVIQAWGGGYVAGRENVHFRQQCEAALEEGLALAAYGWPPREWNDALSHIGPMRQHLAFFALDVEAGEGLQPQYVDGVRAALPPWVYASRNSWTTIMHNTPHYADLPLWVARYPRDLAPSAPVQWPAPTQDPAEGWSALEFGGWTASEVGGWQLRGTTDLCGEQADLNVFRPEAFRLLPKEETMSDAHYEELRGALAATNAILAEAYRQLTQQDRSIEAVIKLVYDNLQTGGDPAEVATVAAALKRLAQDLEAGAKRAEEALS